MAAGKGDFCSVGGSRGGTIAVANDQSSRDEARRWMEAHYGNTVVTKDVHEVHLS
ncbi:MAG: hypothetical protein OEN21_08310 [Myxococcales bacterium]|nr:hypothetical protein [Myxococcales bacterium]